MRVNARGRPSFGSHILTNLEPNASRARLSSQVYRPLHQWRRGHARLWGPNRLHNLVAGREESWRAPRGRIASQLEQVFPGAPPLDLKLV
jgi:hypothetical protein